MRRETLRMVAGIVVVGLVVVATFLYGNHQSQRQMQQEQQLAAKAVPPTASRPSQPAVPKPAPLPAQPQAQPTAIPQTGGGVWPVLAGLGMLVAGRLYLRSRRDLQAARLGTAPSLYKRPRSA